MIMQHPFRDEDRPPRGFPQLHGEMAGLEGVPSSALRHRKLSRWSKRVMYRKLIIAACHDRKIAPMIVAEFLGISAVHVRRIYRQKSNAEMK